MNEIMLKEAMYYEKKDGNAHCFLCPHHCVIAPGKTGKCMVRRNHDGTLVSLNYNKVSSAHMDPIEKKPLYHFHPGSSILSLGTLGCNLSCTFCQNWSISQIPKDSVDNYFKRMTSDLTPHGVALTAQKYEKQGSVGVAYTYNEPSIWYEYVLESAREVKKLGLKNVLVTNGFMEKEPLKELLPYIDAANVDIKSIRDEFYRRLCGAKVQPVLDYCRMVKEKCLLEVTNLIVTGENDSQEDLGDLIDFVARDLGRDTPIHFSRYHPDFNFDAPATPGEVLEWAYRTASEKLDYVYVGNVWNPSWDCTHCPECGQIVIDRAGYSLQGVHLKEGGKCEFCGAPVAVII